MQQQLERMAKSFSGVEIKKQADLALAAVNAIGGASKLTEAEQRKVNATVTDAIAKYRALGQQAPAELLKLQAATATVQRQLENMSKSFSGVEIKKQADLAVASVKAIGGASRLTEQEQRKVNQIVTDAIAKYRALGQQAPAELRKLQAETANVVKSTGLMGTAAAKAGALFAGAFTVGAIVNLSRKVLQLGGDLADMSAQTGIGVRALQEFKFAGGQVGVGLDQITSAINQMQNRIAEGDKSAVGALKRLNISMKEFKALKPEDQFAVVADAIGGIQDPAEKVRTAMDLMGKSGAQLLPVLTAGFNEAREAARRMGVVLDEETIKALDEMGDRLDALQGVYLAGFARLLVQTEPLLIALGSAALESGKWLKYLQDQFTLVLLGASRLTADLADLEVQMYEIARAGNPVARMLGTFDDSITEARSRADAARLSVKFMADSMVRDATRAILALAKLGEVRGGGGPRVSGGAGAAPSDEEIKRFQKWRDEVTGAATEKALQQLAKDWAALTETERDSQPVRARVMEQYEKLRVLLPKVGGALEDLRTANLKTLQPLEDLQRLFQSIASRAIPDANRMFIAGQSALDGFASNGKLVSRQLADMSVQMKAVPAAIFTQTIRLAAIELDTFDVRVGRFASTLASGFAQLAQIADGTFSAIARAIGGFVGQLDIALDAFSGFKAAFIKNKNQLKGIGVEFASSLASGIFGGIAGIANSTQFESTLKNAMGGAVSGAVAGLGIGLTIATAMSAGAAKGAALGIWGAVAGAIVGIFIGIFRGRKTRQYMEDVGREWGGDISKGLAEKLRAQAKDVFGGNLQATEIFNLDAILSELGGLTSSNFIKMFGKLRDVFSMLETGAFTGAQAMEVLDKNFRSFSDYVTKNGSLASARLRELIDLDKILGTNSQAISDFVNEQSTSAVQGIAGFVEMRKNLIDNLSTARKTLDDMVKRKAPSTDIAEAKKNVTELNSALAALPLTAQGALGFGAALAGVFADMLARGKPITEVLALLGPVAGEFGRQMKMAGLSGGAAFDEMLRLATIASSTTAGPALQAVNSLNAAYTGLWNSGLLTTQMFTGLNSQVVATRDALVKQGVDGTDALRLMQPTLQTIWELWTDQKLVIDDATKALLAQAVAEGVVGAQYRTVQEQMLLLTQRMALALEGIADLFGVTLPNAVDDFGDAINDLPDTVSVRGNVDWEVPEPPDGYGGGNYYPGGAERMPGAASGIYATGARGVATWFGEGGEPELGGPVSFMSKALAGAMASMGTGVVGEKNRTATELRMTNQATEFMARSFSYVTDEVDELTDAINNLPDPVITPTINWPSMTPPGGWPEPPDSYRGAGSGGVDDALGPGYAGGTPGLGFMDFGAGRQVTLHNREAVVPYERRGEAAAAWSSGGEINVTFQISALDGADVQRVVQSDEFRRAFQRAITKNEGQFGANVAAGVQKYGVR